MELSRKQHLIVGLTGGIASGKSTVLQRLSRGGIQTVSSDRLAHECLKKGGAAYPAVVRHFGRSILTRGQEIDRAALGAIVFSDAAQRRRLERMSHPCVKQGLRRFIRKNRGLLVLDIPLLFEARMSSWVDVVAVVSCSEACQLKRLRQRNGLSRADALRRIRLQWPLSKKRARADYVLDNTGSFAALQREVNVFARWLREKGPAEKKP